MKAYGLPRVKDLMCPDKSDIRFFGLKSSVGNHPGPGGDIRGSMKNIERKASIRRYWKRVGRAEGKRQCVLVI